MARKDLGGSNEILNSVFSLSLAISHIHKIIGMLGIGKISDSCASDYQSGTLCYLLTLVSIFNFDITSSLQKDTRIVQKIPLYPLTKMFIFAPACRNIYICTHTYICILYINVYSTYIC